MSKEKLQKLFKMVDDQAEDEGLWFVDKIYFDVKGNTRVDQITIGEAHLQQELRKLHALIEALRDGK